MTSGKAKTASSNLRAAAVEGITSSLYPGPFSSWRWEKGAQSLSICGFVAR